MKSAIKFVLINFALILILSCENTAPNNEHIDLTVYGIQINVTNIDLALEFYANKVGFKVKSQTLISAELINDGIHLHINKVSKIRANNFQEESRTSIVLHTNNLDSLITSFKTKGITSIDGKTENGVGYAAAYIDPFLNKIYFMEQSKIPVPWFKEPKIYNTGYSMDNLEKAKEFYCDGLGFNIQTTKYLPALPLNHQDGSFAFMLHKKNVTTTTYNINETQVMMIFSTKNMELLIG